MRKRRQFARTVGHPDANTIQYDLSRNIVHHKREQSLVRIPLRFEYGWNNRPYGAERYAKGRHYNQQHGVGHFTSEILNAHNTGKAAHKHLPLSPDIPELHFECGREGERDYEHYRCVLEEIPNSPFGSEYADKQIFEKETETCSAIQNRAYDGTYYESRNYRAHTNCPRFPFRYIRTLAYVKEGFSARFCIKLHPCPPLLPCVCRRRRVYVRPKSGS